MMATGKPTTACWSVASTPGRRLSYWRRCAGTTTAARSTSTPSPSAKIRPPRVPPTSPGCEHWRPSWIVSMRVNWPSCRRATTPSDCRRCCTRPLLAEIGTKALTGVMVVGSVHMDVVAAADRLPGKGESVVGHRVVLSPGGKAGNQAAQAALNSAHTFLVGRVGHDVFGDRLRAALTRTGVDTTYLTVDSQEATGVSPVLTGADGEYASIIVPGAGQRLEPTDIDAARDAFAQSAVLLLQCEIPLRISAHAARLARSLGGRVIFN